MGLLLVPIAMAAVLAVAWALPLAWWSIGATVGALVLLMAVAAWPARTGWRMFFSQPTTRAASSLLSMGAIGIAYAVRALVGPGAYGHFTRLGYPFLAGTGVELSGGALILLLGGLMSLTPVVLRRNPEVSSLAE